MFQQAVLLLQTTKWKIINVLLQMFIFDAAARGKLISTTTVVEISFR